MLEILVVVLFLLALFAALIVLPLLIVLKAAQLLFEPAINEVVSTVNQVRDYHWRNADAVERERMVRKACAWRVIGRVVGAGALAAGASIVASSTIGFACCLAAWRMLKPIRQEMHDACAFRETLIKSSLAGRDGLKVRPSAAEAACVAGLSSRGHTLHFRPGTYFTVLTRG